MNTSITTFNNILASFLVAYSLLCSKLLDASDYIQEQAELYFIVAKFVYQQAAPRINPLTTLLIFIQAVSVFTLLYACVSRIKSSLLVTKKIKVKCGSKMEEFELVRVRMEMAPSKQPNNPMSLNIITEASPSNSSLRNGKQLQILAETLKDSRDTAPLSDSYCDPIAQASSIKPKYHPIINRRNGEGPCYAEKARLFYEASQKLQQRKYDHRNLNFTRKDSLDRPKPDISGILKARAEFDRKVTASLQSNNDPGHKRAVDCLKYFPASYMNSALLDKQIKCHKGVKISK